MFKKSFANHSAGTTAAAQPEPQVTLIPAGLKHSDVFGLDQDKLSEVFLEMTDPDPNNHHNSWRYTLRFDGTILLHHITTGMARSSLNPRTKNCGIQPVQQLSRPLIRHETNKGETRSVPFELNLPDNLDLITFFLQHDNDPETISQAFAHEVLHQLHPRISFDKWDYETTFNKALDAIGSFVATHFSTPVDINVTCETDTQAAGGFLAVHTYDQEQRRHQAIPFAQASPILNMLLTKLTPFGSTYYIHNEDVTFGPTQINIEYHPSQNIEKARARVTILDILTSLGHPRHQIVSQLDNITSICITTQ